MKQRLIFLILFLALPLIVLSQEIKPEDVASARKIRRAELNDPIRPTWHLTIAEGKGMPFDPNGAIFKDGIYHLWYLYQAEAGHHWQHLSSIDLFHWRWHSNDLQHHPGDPDNGIFSGNAFIAKDGNVVIAYHGLGTGGNCVAYSSDKELNIWEKPKTNPIANPGWDPHMWLEGDTYYQISGGTPVSSGKPNPPVLYVGDSYDMPMKKVSNFMAFDMPDVDDFEDVSCPDFFQIGDKWALVCISHIRGARYYIGTWDGKQFKPEAHHRMNWPGGTVFAPETLLDNKGRRILWTWVLDRKSGVSSGTMSIPRVLTLAKDKLSFNIEPPKEVESLRYNEMHEKPFTVEAGQSVTLKKISGNILEMDIKIDQGKAKRFGIRVFCSKDGREQTPVVIDLEKCILQIDMRQSSLNKPDYREFVMVREPNPNMDTQNAPFNVKNGEKIRLRVFLDKSMLEVFANGRQCITQVLYPALKDAVDIQVFAEDASIKIEELKAWQLFPAMQW
jgi:sucrose-6-phosphate hydrolase SacC (GH32 family)